MSSDRSTPAARWVAVAACVAVVVASVIRPPAALGADVSGVGVDKLAHVAGAAVVAAAVAAVRRAEGRELLAVAAAVVVAGLAVEGVQAPLAYRTFSLADAAANGVGAALGVVGWRVATAGGKRRI